MKRSIAALAIWWVLSLAGYLGAVYLLTLLVQHYPAIGPFVFVDTHGGSKFNFKTAGIATEGIMGVLIFCLGIEAACLGFDNSSLKRLLAGTSASTRVDLFYVAMRFVGGTTFLAFVFSFGTLFWLANQVHRYLHIGVLTHVHSYVLQFICILFINTFLAYWGHRFMHTRWMWEIHKVHHAAEEMNIVTPFRNHPIDHIIMTLMNAFPVALLGGAPIVVAVYYGLNLCYQALVHSEIKHKNKLLDLIWITPAAHRVHHSNRVEHFDTNFGILTFWDYLFGTYHAPVDEKLTYGIEDGEMFNRPDHVSEVFANVRRWFKTSVALLRHSEAQTTPATVKTIAPASPAVSDLFMPSPFRTAEERANNDPGDGGNHSPRGVLHSNTGDAA